MNATKLLAAILCTAVLHGARAQSKTPLPDVSATFKGTLVLPVPVANPLFDDYTETLGTLDGVVQLPIKGGFGLGAGAKMTWFGIKERALAPVLTSGDIRKATFFGKVQYERYTGPTTYYELSGRMGASNYTFDCETCTPESERTVFHWGLGAGFYLHATDNLAFGLTVGYEHDNTRFSAQDLGLEGFPGIVQTEEANEFQNILIGLGFSTRFRRSPGDSPGW